jgi:tRNA nucleotidyltransferase (CCA-adding enzyme)
MRHLRPTKSVLDIARRLEGAGFEAWCVGGAIRDALLGGAPLDWDLATPATPEQVRELFGRRRTIPVGIEFGTVSVLDDDLARRDFTINAIAYRPHTEELRDLFGGQQDIQAGIVRAVGDAEQRMREDRLRALRAIRFAARFEFAIEPDTLAAIRSSAPHLTRLSAERVQQELVKTMEQVQRPSVALRLWRDTGALAVLVPGLAQLGEVALDTLDWIPRAGAGGRAVPQRTSNRLAALFLDVSPADARRTLTALRFSKHETNWVAALAERWESLGEAMAVTLQAGAPDDATVRRWLARLGRMHAGAFLRVARARWEAARAHGGDSPSAAAVRALHKRVRQSLYRDPIEVADLQIGGDDLRRAGIPVGPIYAKILNALLERVLEDPARNTPESLLSEALRVAASFDGAA